MRLSTKELTALLLDKVTREDYRKLAPLIENAQLINVSYNKKDSHRYAVIDACIQRLSFLATHGDSEEALVDSIQALCEHLTYDMRDNPLMYRQAFIMDRMRAAGYRISGIGECYGLSHMAIQAFFAGQLTAFYTRLHRIYDMPIKDFIDDFSGLKEKRRQLLDSGDATEAQHVNDLIVELRAFFDSVALTNRPDRYLHDEDNLPLSSKQLFHKTYPLTQSIVLEEPGKSITVQANFAGAYTKADLQCYLELFTKHASEIPFALNIICNMHSMSLMYDPDTTRWIFCDPNHLPPQEFQSAQVLADAIFAHIKDIFPINLIKDSTLVMGTEITTAAEHAEDFGEKFGALKKDETWIKLHKHQDSFVDYFNLSPKQLYENYYGENKLDLAAADKITLEQAGMGQNIARVVIDYALYYGIDTFINRQNSELAWVLWILPQDLQQQLWEKLSNTSKINVLQSTHDSARQLQLFQSLPQRYKSTIFQQLDVSIQAACLTAVTWEECLAVFTQHTLKDKGVFLSQLNSTHFNSLFNTLSKADKTAVFDHLTPTSQCKALLHESPQEKQRIWLTLPESQQHAILSKGNVKDVAELLFFLVDTDRDKAFLACDSKTQGHILVALNEPEQLAIRHKLLNKLALEQQANILSIGPENYFTYTSYRYLLSYQFFKLLPIEQRLRVFLALSNKAQSNFLYALSIEDLDGIGDDTHLSATDLIKMRDDLIKQLPLSAKQALVNANMSDHNGNADLFQTFTADDLQDTLHHLSPAKQYAMLTSLIKTNELHVASTLIQSLSFEQKLDIFKSKIEYTLYVGKSDVLVMLFKSMSDEEHVKALATEIPNRHGVTIDHFLSRSCRDFLRQSLNNFSINTRFDYLRKNIYACEVLSLNELKAIIQDKINLTITQRTKHRTVFDGIRIDIARAQGVYHLHALLKELDKLFDFAPTEALDTFDTTALAPLDEQQVSHMENLLTLDEILYKLKLNRSQLTSLALKRVWLSIHPDKTTTDQAELSATRRYIQSLQVCLSMSNLVPLHSTPDIEALINDVLSGLTSEDEQFLLEKATLTLGNFSNHSDTSTEFIDAAVKFIETNLASHQQQRQSFTTTLKALSKAASALAHIKERRVFQEDAARYQQEVAHTLAAKTAPASVIVTSMGIFSKKPPSGINESKPDSKGTKKQGLER